MFTATGVNILSSTCPHITQEEDIPLNRSFKTSQVLNTSQVLHQSSLAHVLQGTAAEEMILN